MDYTRIRNTLMSNPHGVMNSILSFGLHARVKSNTRLYFYKYDLYDLVEIKFDKELLCVYDFGHIGDRAVIIKDNLDFYVGYFKSAGLEEKRFLFNLSLRSPVNYSDFIPMSSIPYPNYNEFLFVMDKKEGYVFGEDATNLFVATERCFNVDKCVISTVNNLINIKKPKSFELPGCMSTSIISGLFSGGDIHGIEEHIEIVDESAKFVDTIEQIKFNDEYISSKLFKLKINKFKRILEKSKSNVVEGTIIPSIDKLLGEEIVTKKEIINGEVSLRDIIDQGLDRFIKSIKNPKDVIKVCIDTEYQTIRSAYIVKGVMFITPTTILPIIHFRELLDSDNVEYILN